MRATRSYPRLSPVVIVKIVDSPAILTVVNGIVPVINGIVPVINGIVPVKGRPNANDGPHLRAIGDWENVQEALGLARISHGTSSASNRSSI